MYTTLVVILKKEEDFMNLRDEDLLLTCELDRNRVENLFRQEEVSLQYNMVTQSNRFRRKLKRVSSFLTNFLEELEDSEEEIEGFESLISEDKIMDLVKVATMIRALALSIDKIIFEGRTPEEALVHTITIPFILEVLDLVLEFLLNEIKETLTFRQIDHIFNDWLLES